MRYIAALTAMVFCLPAAVGSGAQPDARPGAKPAPQVQVPDVFRMPAEEGFVGPTTWVSAKAAADADHVVKWGLFGDTSEEGTLHSDIRYQEKTATAPKHGSSEVVNIPESQCPSITIASSFSETPDRPAYTLDQLIANSIAIYAGTIVAITPGFASEVPSELLTLKVQEVLRQPEPATSFPYLHLFYGVAHFRIGTYSFCGRPSSAWGEPEIGDRLLVFVYRWVRQGEPFVSPVEKQLIFGTKRGLQVPAGLGGDPRLRVGDFPALVSAVRQAIQQRGGSAVPEGGRP